MLAYARRNHEAATEAQIDAALADLRAKLKSQRRTLEDFLKDQSSTQADLRRQLAWNIVWEKYVARYVTPERSERYFQEHRRELDGSRVSVSQILLRPADGAGRQAVDALVKQAEDIRRRIVAGTISFADAAEKYSTGPSAKQGGRLGEISPPRRHGRGLFAGGVFALRLAR